MQNDRIYITWPSIYLSFLSNSYFFYLPPLCPSSSLGERLACLSYLSFLVFTLGNLLPVTLIHPHPTLHPLHLQRQRVRQECYLCASDTPRDL